MKKNNKKPKTHPLAENINKHITIYNFRILDDETAVPVKPVVIKDADEMGARFHCELLIPEDATVTAVMHAVQFFETLYPAHQFEFSTTVSEAVSSGHLLVCFVTTPVMEKSH